MEFHYTKNSRESQETQNVYSETSNNPSCNGEYRELCSVLADGGDRFGVSAVVFDKFEELFWMGNQGGHVTSYYGPKMQKYTSFQIHRNEEVRQMITIDQGILALTKSTLRHQIRRGIPKHTHKSQHMIDMQCLLHFNTNRVLMGGHQDKLIDLDLTKMMETVIQVETDDSVVLRSSGTSLVACGSSNGRVWLRDPRAPAPAQLSFQAHGVSLSDLDMQGDMLITCGFALGAGGVTAAEACIAVWDVRALSAVRDQRSGSLQRVSSAPLAPESTPLHLRFLPAVSARAAALTADGRVQIVQLNPTKDHQEQEPSMFQVDTHSSLCCGFDVCSTSQAFGFGDHSGHVNIFSSRHNAEPVFNNFSRETEFADPSNVPFTKITDNSFRATSVRLPPLPWGQQWFSDWPKEFTKNPTRKTKPIDQKILDSMKMNGPIGYAPNPRITLRNQMPYMEASRIGNRKSPVVSQGLVEDILRPKALTVPRKYHKVELRYSKIMGHDSEFEHYNKTGFPGLEATLPNSYCNSMLQILYYIQPLKTALLAHSCFKEFCLSCELGFLFHMLDASSGAPCQASNFLRAFRTIPEAAALGLILSDRGELMDSKMEFVGLIQNWNRFILHQIHCDILETKKQERVEPESSPVSELSASVSAADVLSSSAGGSNASPLHNGHGDTTLGDPFVADTWLKMGVGSGESNYIGGAGHYQQYLELDTDLSQQSSNDKEETDISELFGIKQLQINKCLKCNKVVERESVVLGCALHYPPSSTSPASVCVGSLAGLLRASLLARRTTPAWCDLCRRFSPTLQNVRAVRMPPILAINCGGISDHEKSYWRRSQPSENGKLVTPSPSNSSLKPCRYGVKCTRAGCHFKHPDRSSSSSPLLSPYQSPQKIVSNGLNAYHSQTCILPSKLNVTVQSDGDVIVTENEDLSDTTMLPSTRNGFNQNGGHDSFDESDLSLEEMCVEYSLNAVVCCVEDIPKNIVAYIKMENGREFQWYLFNDVSIMPVSVDEVLNFTSLWKWPCVLYYSSARQLSDSPPPSASSSPSRHARDVFTQDDARRDSTHRSGEFAALSHHDTLTQGTLVGMDAEFVTLNSEEVELRSNGKLSTVRPSHKAVARITCVRGEGPLAGVPFIDDYISTQEQVVDYLTKFSGIKPGDLDANFSSKHLTTLKSTYQKLRYLVDSGVTFVGHGLQNDFRVINLVVPPEQVIDTVQLFHLPHHRMLSLKFLAWHFLGIIIQSETHDSIEDARTALNLRQKWVELASSGELRSELRRLYQEGESCSWTVASSDKKSKST